MGSVRQKMSLILSSKCHKGSFISCLIVCVAKCTPLVSNYLNRYPEPIWAFYSIIRGILEGCTHQKVHPDHHQSVSTELVPPQQQAAVSIPFAKRMLAI